MLYDPFEIERTSLNIIDKRISGMYSGSKLNLEIIKRVIHATADFDFVELLEFSNDVVTRAHEAFKNSVPLVTDTKMLASGINKKISSSLGVKIIQPDDSENIFDEARERKITRSIINIEHAVKNYPDAIFVIGNAPTALIRLCELVISGNAKPALIIGVPVGFVNVIESKNMLAEINDIPKIISHGNKGGSTVACAIVNALLYSLK